MKQWCLVAAMTFLLAGCGYAGPAAVAVASSARIEASPASADRAYAVLVDELSQPSRYTISVVAGDGRVVVAQQAAKRSASSDWLDLPYVSTTSDALYYLDGDLTVRKVPLSDLVQPPAQVTTVDGGAGMETAFAVSPDDKKIAVSVLDFRKLPVHVRLYVDNLGGGDKHVVFESDSDYVWPVAWHGDLLVLAHAYAPLVNDALKAAPARDDPYWAISYHVVDPNSANRVVLMGSCTVSGPLSPAGSACIQGGSIDWQGTVSRAWSTHDWGSISAAASLSPDGSMIAAADPDNPEHLDFWRPDGSIATWVDGPSSQDWGGWLDNTHVVISSATIAAYQPRIVALTAGPSPAVPIAAYGFYAARLPTDIV